MNTQAKHPKRLIRPWLAVVLLAVVAWVVPKAASAADGIFDTPSQAFSWYSKGPGCIHLKILVHDADAKRSLKYAVFGVKDSKESVDFMKVSENTSGNENYMVTDFENLRATADGQIINLTNDYNIKPFYYIGSVAQTRNVERLNKGGNSYAELDWYYPTRFSGRKMTLFLHSAHLWEIGQGKSHEYTTGNKDLGTIEFSEIMLEAYDPIPGTEEADYGTLRIPVASDHVMNWVEAKYKNSDGLWKSVPRVTLEKNSYSAFVCIPSHEAHDSLTITANVQSGSIDKSDLPDQQWPSEVSGQLTTLVGKVGLIHGPRFLTAEVDSTGAVELHWQVSDPEAADVLDGDLFDIQRSLTGRTEDFESIGQELYDSDSLAYTFRDETLIASLTKELLDAKLGIPLVRYRIVRAAAQQLWGTERNPTMAFVQPQFNTLSLLQPKDASAVWTDTLERKVMVSWDYEKRTDSATYVWDSRATMRLEMKLYNRAGKQVDSLAYTLTEEQIKARKLEVGLIRSCVTYDLSIVVDAKDSPIGRGEGDIFVTLGSKEDFNAFLNRVNNGETGLNAIMTSDINRGQLEVKYNQDNSHMMIGFDRDKPYTGNFNGNGHTLKMTLNNYPSAYVAVQRFAPFRFAGGGAVITNLATEGEVESLHMFIGGLVGSAEDGELHIENCRAGMTINQGIYYKDGTSGGVVAVADKTDGNTRLFVTNSLVDGPFKCDKAGGISGFVGYRSPEVYAVLDNCYFNPSSIGYQYNYPPDATFMRSGGEDILHGIIQDCLYSKTYGAVQGKYSATAPVNGCWDNGKPAVKQMRFSKPAAGSVTPVSIPADRFYYQSSGKVDTASLEARTRQSSVLLRWQKTEGVIDYFEVHRRTTDENSEWEIIATQLTDLEYEDKTVSPVADYYYKVSSNNDCEGRQVTFTDSVPGNCVKTGKVEGYVRFADGTGIPGVSVTASPSGEKADPKYERSTLTDESGFYCIDSLAYWGPQQGAYQLTVNGVSGDALAENCKNGLPVTFDATSNYEKGYTFTVVKGVRFSGLVMYQGTSIPVHGARFLVDGREVRSGSGAVESDFEGKFSFRMLAGRHTIQAVMDGHTFCEKGFYSEKNQTEVKFDVDVANIYFYDNTCVKLVGRVAGGRKQGDLPLENSLSTNNLGDNLKMVLTLEGDNASWLVFDNVHRSIIERDTTYIHKKHGSLDKNEYKTRVHTTRHRMEVWPDSLTGEYQVLLPPVKWKIQQITAEGYATLFQEGKTSDVIDLTDSLTLHSDTLVGKWKTRSNEDVKKLVVSYHAQYNRIYRSPIVLDRQQVGYDNFDYFGEKNYTMRTMTGEKKVTPIAYPVTTKDPKTGKEVTKTRYTFDYPVFSTDRGYTLRLSAVERYYYNNNVNSDTVDVVKRDGGFVTIRNGFISGTHRDTLSLDSIGEGSYILRAEQRPYLLTGKDALNTVSFTLEYDGVTCEAEPLKGYVFSQYAKQGAKDIMSIDRPVLVDILRDPPGASSTAKLSKGSTLKLAYQMDMAWSAGLTIGIGAGGGMNAYTGVVAAPMGAGATWGVNYSTSSIFNTSFDIIFSGTGQRAFSYTMTANEDISTDGGTTMVGADADLYMGMETNLFVRPSVAIQAINDSVFQTMGGALAAGNLVEIARGRDEKDSVFHLVRSEVLSYGQKINSTFVHSQQYIVKQLMPNIAKEIESLMFTGTETEAQTLADATGKPVYLSLIDDVKSKRFAAINSDSENNDAYVYNTNRKRFSDQSRMNYLIVLPTDYNDASQEDRVHDLSNTLYTWASMIARNEKEKLQATELVKNFDVDGGSSISYSEDFASEYSNTSTYNWLLTDVSHNYFDEPTASQGDQLLNNELNRLAGAANILGPTISKLLGAVMKTTSGSVGAYTTPAGQGKVPDPLKKYDINFVGIKFNFSFTPVISYKLTPKLTENEKYNRKESFTIKMDKKSHLDFDLYRVKVIDTRDSTTVDSRTDVFVEENFLNSKEYVEHFIDRGVGSRDISKYFEEPRSFVYRTRGGATVRTWEPERRTQFYRSGTVLDERTKKIENPVIRMDKQSISGVPADAPARFKIYLTNESEAPEAIGGALQYFTLYHDDTSNPNGARLLVDGMPLSRGGMTVKAIPGEITEKTLEVWAGEEFDYENLKIGLISPADVQCVQEIAFSVHFLRTAGNVEIATPGDKWIMNTDAPSDKQRGWYLPVIISGFDKNQKNFDHIEFQYKESTRGDDYWTNLCAFYADSALYRQATGTHEMIPENGNIVTRFYGEGTVMEKAYDLRARLYCRNGNSFLTNDSKVLSGIKDTRRPQLFGTPEPTDGIIGAGENIVFNFSEAIEHNYLQQATNFEVVGETNETAISEEPSLLFSGKGYAETDARRNFAGKNITIDLMVHPEVVDRDMPLFSHGTDGRRLQLWLTKEWHLRAVIDSISFESKKAIGKGELKQVALILDNEHKQALLYNDSIIGTCDSVAYAGYGTLIFGSTNEVDVSDRRYYSGRMLEARLWNRTMTTALLTSYGKRQLTGYELGLADYYPMNDGETLYAVDKAQGANASLHGATWVLPRGMSLRLDFDEQKAVKGMKLDNKFMERSAEHDYTLMFWFKTDERGQGALLSNGSGRKTDSDARNKFFIGFESGQLKYRTNGREVLLGKQWADDTWHHFAITVDRSHKVANIYVDRVLRSSFSTDTLGGMVSKDFYVGNMVWHEAGANTTLYSQNALSGNIDELCLFAQALPPTLLRRYSTKSPGGLEKGLLVYLGFNRQERQQDNKLELNPYARNQLIHCDLDGNPTDEHDSVFAEPLAYVLEHIDQDLGAPVQPGKELRNLNFSFVGRANSLLVNIDELDARINKRNIYVTVTDIPDMNGNYMASPATVEYFVDRNPLRWDRKSCSEEIYDFRQDYDEDFEVKVLNNSGSAHTYTIENLPRWLTVDRQTDIIEPQDEHVLHFNVNADLNVGTYDEVIYLTDENGLAEPLSLSIRKNGSAPSWYVPSDRKHFSMNLVGQVRMGDALVTDRQDMVGAFDSEGNCVGTAYVDFNSTTGRSMLFITIFNVSPVSDDALTFKLWHNETGQILLLELDRDVTFTSSQVIGSVDAPIVMKAGSLYYQQLEITPGWNWVSFNVSNKDFRTPMKLLSRYEWEDGDIVTDDTEDFTFIYNKALGTWLSNKGEKATGMSISNKHSYRIYVQRYATVEIPGYPLRDEALRTIPIIHGWNNIGYTPMVNLPVSTALADYTGVARNRDVVKSREEFAVFTETSAGAGYWSGSLQYMKPGEGYMLYHGDEKETSFRYPYYEPGSTFFEKSVAQAPARSLFTHAYPNNMSLAASIRGIDLEEGDRLLAFCGGELRGEAAATDSVFYLSIAGQQKAPLSFAIERDGKIVATANEVMDYESNAVSGSPAEPTAISFVTDDLPQYGWYTIEGYKLEGKPQRKGVYIHNGKKQVVK